MKQKYNLNYLFSILIEKGNKRADELSSDKERFKIVMYLTSFYNQFDHFIKELKDDAYSEDNVLIKIRSIFKTLIINEFKNDVEIAPSSASNNPLDVIDTIYGICEELVKIKEKLWITDRMEYDHPCAFPVFDTITQLIILAAYIAHGEEEFSEEVPEI